MALSESTVDQWSPAAGLVVLAWIGAAAAVGWLLLALRAGSDPGALMFSTVTIAALLLAAVFGTRARPRLRADADGLTVGGLTGSRHHPWPLVRDVRIRQVRRLGREMSFLEVTVLTSLAEADAEQLRVFGRLDLDADPDDVADRVRAIRPPRREHGSY